MIHHPVEGNSNNTMFAPKAWPGGMVNYLFSGQFQNREKAAVNYAFKILEDQTCIRFEKMTIDHPLPRYYVLVIKKHE